MLKVISRTKLLCAYDIDVLELLAEESEKYEERLGSCKLRIYWVQKGEVIFTPIRKKEPTKVGDKLSISDCCNLAFCASGESGIRYATMH